MPKRINALILFSGGLDSILSVKLLQKQRIKVTGLVFVSYFFNSQLATKAAKKLKIKLKIVNFSEEHFKIVKKPEYGYGKAMNPCIDCHLLMLKKAKKIMEDSVRDEKFDFIATGEVLGERPMSQNRQALELIERESGLKGYLLRPLSAKLLEPTVAEKKGLVNRDKFLDISGRSRKRQMALAKKWKIKEYPTPAGGCLLTDPQFGQRLKELLEKWPKAQGNDVELLKLGRHFWVTPAPEKTQRGVESNKIIVGRNKEENKKIKKLAQKGDLVIEPRDFPGPTVLIRSKNKLFKESLAKAKELMIKHSPKLRRKLGIDK